MRWEVVHSNGKETGKDWVVDGTAGGAVEQQGIWEGRIAIRVWEDRRQDRAMVLSNRRVVTGRNRGICQGIVIGTKKRSN